MTRGPIRAGIVGLSWIAADPAAHAASPEMGTAPPYSHASAMAAVGGIELRAVCDLDGELRSRFVETWEGTWPGIATFADLNQMLAEPLDLVSIVTPDHLHGPMLLHCLEAGVPMIFSEKPFTTDLLEADRILALAAETGTSIAVNHTWRWRPEVAEAKAILGEGRMGPLSHVAIEAGGPRAMLYRNLSHFLDLAIHLVGTEPMWVSAELEPGTGEYGLSYTGDGGHDPGRDPGAMVTIGFPDGIRALVIGRKSALPDVVVQMACEHGRITIDHLGARTVSVPRTADGTPGTVSGPVIQPVKPRFTVSGMEACLADLVASHRAGKEPSGSARTARRTVAAIDAVLRSHAAGGSRVEVTPPPSAASGDDQRGGTHG